MNLSKRLLIDFLQLDKRIQIASAVGGSVFLVFVTYVLVIQPVFNELNATEKRIQTTEQKIKSDQTKLTKLKKFNVDKEIAEHQDKIKALEEKIAAVQSKLSDTAQFYLGTQAMKNVMMPNIISHNLKLTNFILLPQQTFDTKGVKVPYLLYKHPAKIEFEGTFDDIYNYLNTIHNLEKRIYLTQLNLSVKAYPTLKLSMEVYAFSDGKKATEVTP